MPIQIKTNEVQGAANNIQKLNNEIDDSFSAIEDAIAKLSRSWSGPASDNGIGSFTRIQSAYRAERKRAVDQVVRFLGQQVSESYEETEKKLTKAADAFDN